MTPRHMTSYSPCVWSMAIISSGFCHFLGIGMCSSITRKMKVYSLCWVSSTGRRGWSPSRDSNQLNSMLKFKNTPQTVSLRLFYVSLCSQAPQQQYTIHCMDYYTVGIPFWTARSQMSKFDGKTTIPCAEVTHYRYVRVMERYIETLHVKKVADL